MATRTLLDLNGSDEPPRSTQRNRPEVPARDAEQRASLACSAAGHGPIRQPRATSSRVDVHSAVCSHSVSLACGTINPVTTDHESESWTIRHFSQSNPKGPGQADVPALLRRLAATIEDVQPIEVQDIVFHTGIDDDGEDWPTTTV